MQTGLGPINGCLVVVVPEMTLLTWIILTEFYGNIGRYSAIAKRKVTISMKVDFKILSMMNF